jgi:hypothetical protein
VVIKADKGGQYILTFMPADGFVIGYTVASKIRIELPIRNVSSGDDILALGMPYAGAITKYS